MTAPPTKQEPAHRLDDAVALINDLTAGGALTANQAERLVETWPHLDDVWAACPYFGTVGEHSRAYIGLLASRSAGDTR